MSEDTATALLQALRSRSSQPPASSCFHCIEQALVEIDTEDEDPLVYSCVFSESSGSSCCNCSVTNKSCEPVPFMLQFDAMRLGELLEWSSALFAPKLTAALGLIWDKEGNICYLTEHVTRRDLHSAQYGLVRSFCELVSAHRAEFGLAGDPGDETKVKNLMRYESVVFQRRAFAGQETRPPPADATADEHAQFKRSLLPRARPWDMGYAAWSVAVGRFMHKLERISSRDPAINFEEIRKDLSDDVLEFQ